MKTMFKVKVCLLMLLCSVAAAMANPPVPVEKVKGTIKTPNGEPVIGATIIEKGTTNGTITDVNGNFVLKIMNKIGELEMTMSADAIGHAFGVRVQKGCV